jgi:hypothetical protein
LFNGERFMKAKATDELKITRRDAMTSGVSAAALAKLSADAAVPAALTTASVAIATGAAHAEQPSSTAPQVTQPASGILMTPGYARTIAQFAYVWGWPIVNMLNRSARITQAPYPGLLDGILPAAPRGQIGMLHDYILPSEPSSPAQTRRLRSWLLLAR